MRGYTDRLAHDVDCERQAANYPNAANAANAINAADMKAAA